MGKFLAIVTIGMTVLFFLCITEIRGQEKSCKATIADLTKRQLSGISKCTKSLKFKNGKEKAAKSSCILKCVMMNEGIFNAEGQMTQEVTEAFIKNTFAEELRPKVMKLFQPCMDEYGGKLDNEDEFCKSYDPFIKCMTGILPLLCA